MKKILSSLRKAGVVLVALSVLGACTKKASKGASENTLRLPMISDAKTLDPQRISDYYSNIASSLVSEGLLEYHYLKRPHEVVPLLAESMPEVSKDGLTYTFKIKKGVRFADDASFPEGKGREVKAQDFVYSFLRVADPKVNSGAYWIFEKRILGLEQWRAKQKDAATTDYANPPEGFRAIDDYTLQIRLTERYPQLLFVLAMPQTFVVPREAVEKLGDGFGRKPVGTGPYLLSNWMQNSKLEFVRNPNWRGQKYPSEGEASDSANGLLADAGKDLPFADKVELMVFTESQPMWLSFLKGSLDTSSIPKDNFGQAVDPKTRELLPDMANKGIRLTKAQEPDVVYYAFNMEDPFLKKAGPKLRQAIALALDKEKTIELFYNGRAILAHSPVPPGVAGYDESFKNPYSAYNVEQAKKLLAEAGFPEGKGLPELVFETTTGTDQRQRAEKMQQELAQVGIKVRVQTNQFPELLEKIDKKRAQFWGIAWLADYPDAENFLQLLYGPNKAPSPNGSNFDNAEYNKLYTQVRGMADSPERRAMINQMKAIFVREMPWIVEAHRIRYNLSHAWISNYKADYMGGTPAKFLRVDTARRAQGLK